MRGLGGEQCSTPPLTSPLFVMLVLYVVIFVLLAGGEQGSTPPSPMSNRYVMMFIISTMICRGCGFHGDIPLGFVVVCVCGG